MQKMSDSDAEKKLRCKGWGEHEGEVKERKIPMRTVKDRSMPYDSIENNLIEVEGIVIFCEKHYNEYMKAWELVSSMDGVEILKLFRESRMER